MPVLSEVVAESEPPSPALLADARRSALVERVWAVAHLPPSERFHWLSTPRSTMIQPSPMHSGLCEDPAAMLAHLFERVVGPGGAGLGGAP